MSQNDDLKIEARRSQIIQARIAGLPIEEIAKNLQLSPTTVKRDLKVIGREKAAEIRSQQDTFIAEFCLRKEHELRILWELYEQQPENATTKERCRIIALIDRIDYGLIEALMNVGWLPKRPDVPAIPDERLTNGNGLTIWDLKKLQDEYDQKRKMEQRNKEQDCDSEPK